MYGNLLFLFLKYKISSRLVQNTWSTFYTKTIEVQHLSFGSHVKKYYILHHVLSHCSYILSWPLRPISHHTERHHIPHTPLHIIICDIICILISLNPRHLFLSLPRQKYYKRIFISIKASESYFNKVSTRQYKNI